MIDQPIHVSDSEFEAKVVQSNLPVIVDFWAPWCGPCLMVAPILDKIAKEYSGRLVVAKVNTDENAEWAGKYGVMGIPTMLFFQDGEIAHTQVGAVPEPFLRQLIGQIFMLDEKEVTH